MTPGDPPLREFRCGVAARWLPRALAAAVLLATMLVSFRFQAWGDNPGGSPLRLFLVIVGAAGGLWILRSGAEVRIRASLTGSRLMFAYGSASSDLPLERIERFEFDHPMTASRRPLPAAVLIDDKGRAWRLPAVIDAGAELIEAIVKRSGREDLAAWADSLSLSRRMARAGRITAIGYGVAVSIALAGAWFYVH